MEKNENSKLIQAVLEVMKECETIEKNTTVGKGSYSYKGVSDKDVKLKIGRSMQKNGLAIFPIGIEKEMVRYEGEDKDGKPAYKYFTEVVTKYELCHVSGESKILTGYGQGADTQDKGAGKATTYALKYTLLYTFLVATGAIDDTDNTHSEEIKEPAKKAFTQERFDKFTKRAEGKTKNEVMQEVLKTKKTCIVSQEIQEKFDLFLKSLSDA